MTTGALPPARRGGPRGAARPRRLRVERRGPDAIAREALPGPTPSCPRRARRRSSLRRRGRCATPARRHPRRRASAAPSTRAPARPPAAAGAADVSHPDHVIGHGTAASCTSAAVVKAVATGGTITFDCGPDPVTIDMTATLRSATTRPQGGDRRWRAVTLSGGGKRRILYLNTCDKAQVWTTSHCHDQDHPQLVCRTSPSPAATPPAS